MHITNPFANPEKIIGICGGGQLGKMLCEAASAWDWKTAVLDQSPDDPAARLAHKFVQGDFTKYEDVLNFGKQVDVLTIEIEKVNLEALIELEKMGKIVHPSPRALGIIKDKALQKQFFIDQGLPTVPQELFDTKDDVLKAIESGFLQIPFVQKLRTDGYDGRGVAIIRTEEDLNLLLDGLCLVEPLVEIEAEVAVIAARNVNGEIKTFPPVAMAFHPEANLVEYLYCPSGLGPALELEATQIAQAAIEALDICGLLAVEMFLTADGDWLINEVAPRPHNSGHHTIECCNVSQFQQHLLAICNLPLIDPQLQLPGVMINLLGEEGFEGPVKYMGVEQALRLGSVYVHLYGKKITKPFRKMGHITVANRSVSQAIRTANFLKEHIKVIS
ncbi:MAG: 5-(carboxyamino)imidazole ribonucleotide synthase [Saprospiraceae bacterium]|mgnify:FL=1|nr:5-(carboxyamino)imidazole ribonucleotide synthase [Candidatus Opimibacter skivensis]MBL0005685.1 5-(carboxyamino)imidazole ribonucleotide synthase [Candidatus Opimibacter skivensis]MBP6679785.1 5-(carboxyamino)imidazole ribonucleotide synthase [Saprospiraceae bacterium]MBP8086375.1 5-(carboxyamino)imidazole ribonucleotide synthase [Saprospiraceae bacterium]